MEQVIIGGAFDPPSVADSEYIPIQGGRSVWYFGEFARAQLVSTSGKIKKLRVELDGAPGIGKQYSFHLMVNGAPSALSCSISGIETSNEDSVSEVDVVAGDYISLRCIPDSTPTARAVRWTMVFEGNTKESLLLGNTDTEDKGARYTIIMGRETLGSTESDSYQVCPTSGKIKNLYVKLDEDPGTAPSAWKFTLRKNGASQSLTVTIVADDTTGNDTVNEVTVVAGDVLDLMVEPIASPSNEPKVSFGMTFEADIDGESIILGRSIGEPLVNTTEYTLLCEGSGWASEAARLQLAQACTLKKLYVELENAPGDGKSFTFTLRKPGNGQAAGNLTVTITGAATTTGNDVAHTDVISDGDEVGIESVPAGTPTTGVVYWGLVGYIEPPVVGLENKSANMASKMVAAGLI